MAKLASKSVTLTVNAVDLTAYAVKLPGWGQKFIVVDSTTFSDTADRVVASIEAGQTLVVRFFADDTAVTGSIAALKSLPGTAVTSKLTLKSGTLSYQHSTLVESLMGDPVLKSFVFLDLTLRTDSVATVGT